MEINIGHCFKVAQSRRGYSNTKVANDFGVYRQQVNRWRTADDMSLSKIVEFAKYFKYSVHTFLKLGEKYEPKEMD